MILFDSGLMNYGKERNLSSRLSPSLINSDFRAVFLRKFLDGGRGRRDVAIDVLAGSSAASIIGANYASGVSPTPAPPKRELAFILR